MWPAEAARTLILVLAAYAATGAGAGAGSDAEVEMDAGVVEPRCPATAGPQCSCTLSAQNYYHCVVKGYKISISFVDSQSFKVACEANGLQVLDDVKALPRFPAPLRVLAVSVTMCAPPKDGYSGVLRAFNVALSRGGNLTLTTLGSVPPLAAAHLTGLNELEELVLRSGAATTTGFLMPLRHLRRLIVFKVVLPAGELEHLPTSLVLLHLSNTGTSVVPASVLALPTLRHLLVTEDGPVVMQVAPGAVALRTLYLEAPGTVLPPMLPLSALETLDIRRSTELRPPPLAECDALRSLSLTATEAQELPPSWVARCGKLERLVVDRAGKLSSLPSTLLQGAAQLVELRMRFTRLVALPPGLLDDAPNLRTLDLRHNKLRTLPSGLFLRTRALSSLDLSFNDLDTSALEALRALRSLTLLNLQRNLRLGDSCLEKGDSPLSELKNLTSLSLSNTNVTVICRDWRQKLLQLEKIDLSNTKLSVLTYAEMQWGARTGNGAGRVQVNLRGAPLEVLVYSRAEYQAALSAGPARAELQLDAALACDCRMYWAVAALRDNSGHAALAGMNCAADGGPSRPLSRVPLEHMLCAAPELCNEAALPAPCACSVRPDRAAPRPALRVRCANGSLERIPPQVARLFTNYSVELLLPANRITTFRATDLPAHLKTLDLSDNLVSVVDSGAAAELGRNPGRDVRLRGNPLACDCRAAPLLAALRPSQDIGASARCADGRTLADAAPEPCTSTLEVTLGAVLAVPLVACVTLAACLSRRAPRHWIKAALMSRGWLPAPSEEEARRFDLFISFAHEDAGVVRELVARLEGEYRVCVHARDWVPGRSIPAQIAASVAQSRRTLAVVSRHFVASAWARAEFRAAAARGLREAAPRLVVLLLEPPAALPLDAELRAHLTLHTYVLWDDPRLWEKLRRALPKPSRPLPASAGTVSAPSAPSKKSMQVFAPSTPLTQPPANTITLSSVAVL